MNEVEDAGFAPAGAQGSLLEQEYPQVNENFRRLSDIRFRLLAFVPALGGVAVYVLATAGLAAESAPRQQPTNADLLLVALISAIGFFVTLGIVFYDQRNSELYNALIHRARFLERESILPRSSGATKEVSDGGQFNERPGRDRHLFGVKRFEMGHDTALALIYGTVLGAWFFPFLLSALNLAGDSSLIAYLLAATIAVFAGGAFTWELVRQDRADSERWNMAGLIDTLATDFRDLMSQDPTDESNRDEEINKLLDDRRTLERRWILLEERWILKEKITFARIREGQDPSELENEDLLIEFRYLIGPDSFDEAVDGIVENMKNSRYPKKCHILLLAYDPNPAVPNDIKHKVGIKKLKDKARELLEGNCTVRVVNHSRKQ